MTSVSRFKLRWALFVLAVLAVGFSHPLRAQEDLYRAAGLLPSPKVNPDGILKTLEGQAVPLNEFRGKVVVLNFWATWCPPCRFEMPSMETLYRDLKERDFTILAVSIDASGPEPIRQFAKELSITFPIFHDPKMELASKFGVHSLPTTFLIDQKGKVLGHAVGPREWDKGPMRALLESLLKDGKR